MPFLPWKKVKNNRISKLVNDHLHKSQMRRDGSSLVVETGFATSLVDLFIKNREKLKKPSKRKRKSSPIIAPSGHGGGGQAMPAEITPLPSPLEVELPSPPPSAKTPLSCCPSPLQSPPPSPSKDVVGEILVLRNNNVGDRDGSEVHEERAGIFMIIFKMFLVVVLGLLGTEGLALGITMSACFLFFLEYVMKLSPVKAKTLPRFWRLLRSEVEVINSKSNALAAKIEEDEFLTLSGSSPTISESRHDGVQEIQAAEEIRPSENEQDIEHRKDEFASEPKKMKKSRRAAMKSKVKKFMANKKFDTPRKVHEIKEVAKEESETVSRFLSPSPQKEEDNNRVSEVKEKTTDFGPSLRFLAVLCLIILIGLVRSRLTALVLALFSCVLLRLCEPLSNFLS